MRSFLAVRCIFPAIISHKLYTHACRSVEPSALHFLAHPQRPQHAYTAAGGKINNCTMSFVAFARRSDLRFDRSVRINRNQPQSTTAPVRGVAPVVTWRAPPSSGSNVFDISAHARAHQVRLLPADPIENHSCKWQTHHRAAGCQTRNMVCGPRVLRKRGKAGAREERFSNTHRRKKQTGGTADRHMRRGKPPSV